MSNEKPSAAGPLHGGIVACLSYDNNANEAGEFYKKAFGARELNRVPAQDGKRLMHLNLEINGNSFIINDCFPEHGHPYVAPANIVLHVQVEDVQPVWDRAVAAGCQVVMPLEVMFWGDRYGHLVDPYGVRWALASKA
jgi:uncharacterized glyoxalase superfamily protein PhnB